MNPCWQQSSKMNCKEIKERVLIKVIALLKSLKLYNLAVGNDDKDTNNIEELKEMPLYGPVSV